MVAERRVQDVVAQEVTLDVEEALPLLEAVPLVDVIAGAEQEVGHLGGRAPDHPAVVLGVHAGVAVDDERQRDRRADLGRGRELAGPAGGRLGGGGIVVVELDPVAVAGRRAQPDQLDLAHATGLDRHHLIDAGAVHGDPAGGGPGLLPHHRDRGRGDVLQVRALEQGPGRARR
ncbi:MAG: hypothetical protein R2939_23000 [Kofleriaceae bacterium]